MSLFGAKSPFKSLTIWGAVLSLGSSLDVLQEALRHVPVEALPPQVGAGVTATVGIIGAVLSIIGRVKASKRISIKG